MTWKFRRAWPCKWSGPTLNARHNEVAIETLEICHEGLELE
jgi:phage tail-like protein